MILLTKLPLKFFHLLVSKSHTDLASKRDSQNLHLQNAYYHSLIHKKQKKKQQTLSLF